MASRRHELPALDLELLSQSAALAEVVEQHVAALTEPAPEIDAIVEVLGSEHGEQLRHLLDLIATRHVEIAITLVRTAIVDTAAFTGAVSPVDAEPVDDPLLDEVILGHEALLGWAIDQLFRDDARHRRQLGRIRRLQGVLHRLVSGAAWRAYLKLEGEVNARAADVEVAIVRWAFRQGRR